MTVPTRPFRVLSYNIKSASHHPDGLEAIARVVAASDADVVALQEVDRTTLRSGHVDQTAWLRERLGYEAASFGEATPWTGGGHYGLALLSRTTMRDLAVERLWVPRPGEAPDRETEPRIVLAARVAWDGREVVVANVHLGLSPLQRMAQTQQVVQFVQRYAGDAPAVVMGDFNASPDALEMRVVHDAWHDAMASASLPERWTFPSRCMRHEYDGVPSVCDYVFVSDAFDVSARVVSDASCASDHDPLLAACSVLTP